MGDFISLRSDEGYMHAQALVLTRLGVRLTPLGAEPPRFHEHVFRLCPALRYEAQEAARMRRGLSRSNSLSAKEMSEIEDQERVERAKNDSVVKKLDAESQPELVYGGKVQLLHVYSGKFVEGRRATAEKQRENLLLTMHEEAGSANSAFVVRPRYNYRTEGDYVYFGDEIVLESCELAPSVVGASSVPFNQIQPELCEVSLVDAQAGAAGSSGWAIDLYARQAPHEARDFLTAGAERNVRFWHSHTHGYLTASADERKSPPRPYLRKAHNEDQHDEGNHTTKSLWSFEFAKTATSGGALQWAPQNAGQSVGAGAKEKVRVRHVATGRYLAVVPKDRRSAQTLREIESGAQEPDAGAEFDMTLEDEPTPRGEFFLHPIIELTSDKRIKKDDCSVRLEHVFEHAVSVSDADGRREVKTCWFHQPKGKLKPKKGPRTSVPDQTPPSLDACFSEQHCVEDPFDVVIARDKEVLDVKKILAMKPVADRYTGHVRHHGSGAGDALTDTQFNATERMLAQAIEYPVLTGKDDVGMDPLEVDGPPIKNVQDMMRELKLLDALFPMVHAVATSGCDLGRLSPQMDRLHALVFKAIIHCVFGNRRSEIYFASHRVPDGVLPGFDLGGGGGPTISWLAATIRQVAHRKWAATTLTTILSNNVQLLDEYVDEETVSKFIQLICDQGPQKRFMAFFQAICSCGGQQIISNQELCLSRLVLDHECNSKLFVQTRTLGREHGVTKPWTPSTTFPPKFLAKDVWDSGFENVFVAWSCADSWERGQDELFHSPSALHMPGVVAEHDRKWVPVEQLCWVLEPAALFDRVLGGSLGATVVDKRAFRRRSMSPAPDTGCLTNGENGEKGKGGASSSAPAVRPWWAESAALLRAGDRQSVTNPRDERVTFVTPCADPVAAEMFAAQEQLVLYYESQIDTLAEMCLDRSYNVINELERQWAYPMLVSLMGNDNLPDQIRASFAILLLRVWIDRYPHNPLSVPENIQVMDAIMPLEKVNTDYLPQFTVDKHAPLSDEERVAGGGFLSFGSGDGEVGSCKFHIVEDFLIGYLTQLDGCQVAAEKEKNVFTVACLKLMERCIEFGFYGSLEEVQGVTNPLISTLDGRADKVRRNDVQPGDPARKEENDGTLLVMECKQRMIDSCTQLAKLRDDYRLTLLLANFKKSVVDGRPLLRHNQGEHPEGGELLGWDLTEDFHGFFNQLFEPPMGGSKIDGTCLDLDSLSDAPLSTILMDLMMYNSPELFEAALSQLHSIFNQRSDTIKAMDGVQLLMNDAVPLLDTLSLLKSEVALVRHRVESYETWGVANSFSPIDDAVSATVLEGLSTLTDFCYCAPRALGGLALEESVFDLASLAADEWDKAAAEEIALAERKPTREWQDLLRNLMVPSILVRGVRIPYRSFADAGLRFGIEAKNRKASYECLRTVVKASWKCVQALVSGNKANQNLLLQEPGFLDFMVAEMLEDPDLGIAFIFVELFRGNTEAIELCDGRIFEAFGARLDAHVGDSVAAGRFLAFFETMVEVPGKGVVASAQRKTIHTLTSGARKPGVLALAPPKAGKPGELEYHVRLVNLLTKCCADGNTPATASAQQCFSAGGTAIVALVADTKRGDLRRRAAYIRLLNTAFMDTMLMDQSLRHSPKLWDLLDKLVSEARDAARQSASAGEEKVAGGGTAGQLAFARSVSVPLLEVFFSKHLEEGITLSKDNLDYRKNITNTLGVLANDESADEELRGFAFGSLEKLDGELFDKLRTSANGKALSRMREAASMRKRLSRRSSSASALMGKEERELMRQPNLYFKLLTEVCLAHPEHNRRLLEDSDGRTELDVLVEQILRVESLTDPKDPTYEKLRQGIVPKGLSSEKVKLAQADVRAQPITTAELCNRMIDHVADNLNREINSGYDTVKVNTTVLNIMAAILEKVHPKGEAEDDPIALEAYRKKQREMMDFGGARLVIDIIGCKPPAPRMLVEAAIDFGIEMLDLHNPDVQADMLEYLNNGRSDQFFFNCREYLIAAEKAIVTERAQAAKGAGSFEDAYEKKQRFTMGLVELLRLFMEGHNLAMQDILRAQPENKKDFNLLGDVVDLCSTIAKDAQVLRGLPTLLLELLEKLLGFLVEATQGPCPGNQEHLACHSLCADVIKRIMVSPIHKPGENDTLTVAYARVMGCKLLSSILEGSSKPTIFHALLEKFDKHFFRYCVNDRIYLACENLEKQKKPAKLATPRSRQLVSEERKRVKDAEEKETAKQKCRRGSTLRLAGSAEQVVISERARLAAETECEQLLEGGTELVSTFMKLAAHDEELMKGIIPNTNLLRPNKLKQQETKEAGEERTREVEFNRSYRFLDEKIKRVEFEWHNGLHITYFPVRKEAEALKQRMIDQLKDKVSTESPDLKRRDFLKYGQETVDEMCHLYEMRQLPGFKALQSYYMNVRYFAFLLVVMLNLLLLVTVQGPGNEGPDYRYHAIFISKGDDARFIVRIFQLSIMFCYVLCLLHQVLSRVKLIYKKTERDLATEARSDPTAAKKLAFVPALTKFVPPYVALVVIYGAVGLIVQASPIISPAWQVFKNDHYFEWGMYFAIVMLPFVLRSVFAGNSDCFSLFFDTAFKFIAEPDTLGNLIWLSCLLVGEFRFYFLAFPLLDIVALSPRLINVIKSVTLNLTDLALVFMLMIFVAYIFSMMGLFMFGQQYLVLEDEFSLEAGLDDGKYGNVTTAEGVVAPAGETMTCFDLLSCFAQTLDAGLRTGDIIDSSMDDAFFGDGQMYIDRVIFGLVFFLVLGVILFDIVTGIIIDKFGELREQTNSRNEYFLNTAFISEFERSDYEEIGPEFKLEKLEKMEQPVENYILFIAHLRMKDPNDYTGAEYDIQKKIEILETDWLPNKKSWRMVSADGEEDDEEDTHTIVVEMRQKIETLETGLTYMKGLMEHVAFPTST